MEGMTESCGKVFADMGFDKAEAANLRLRSQLMVSLERFIKANGLTQQDAAAIFGVTQSLVSDLMRGKIALFSLDTLVNMATKAGLEVTLSTKEAA